MKQALKALMVLFVVSAAGCSNDDVSKLRNHMVDVTDILRKVRSTPNGVPTLETCRKVTLDATRYVYDRQASMVRVVRALRNGKALCYDEVKSLEKTVHVLAKVSQSYALDCSNVLSQKEWHEDVAPLCEILIQLMNIALDPALDPQKRNKH